MSLPDFGMGERQEEQEALAATGTQLACSPGDGEAEQTRQIAAAAWQRREHGIIPAVLGIVHEVL